MQSYVSGGAGGLAVAGVAPHAGWQFSGSVAAKVFARLDPNAATVVIVGGHLHSGDAVVAADEDCYETPQGNRDADTELLARLGQEVALQPDLVADNTVEVQLGLAAHFFPGSRVLGMRAPPSEGSYELGGLLYRAALELDRTVVIVGSTDLTHYGPNYGFSPAGEGRRAVEWVRNTNDARMIEALVGMDPSLAVNRAQEERSACSVGGALVAMGFAAARGIQRGRVIDYLTSYDVRPDASFVGYAGIVYEA